MGFLAEWFCQSYGLSRGGRAVAAGGPCSQGGPAWPAMTVTGLLRRSLLMLVDASCLKVLNWLLCVKETVEAGSWRVFLFKSLAQRHSRVHFWAFFVVYLHFQCQRSSTACKKISQTTWQVRLSCVFGKYNDKRRLRHGFFSRTARVGGGGCRGNLSEESGIICLCPRTVYPPNSVVYL